LVQRGIDVSCETVRRWSVKFGLAYARKLRHSHPRADVRWYLDEVFVRINGKCVYLWRAACLFRRDCTSFTPIVCSISQNRVITLKIVKVTHLFVLIDLIILVSLLLA
jgi:hypothetical protein